jgi:O-glycosyl hydrolase
MTFKSFWMLMVGLVLLPRLVPAESAAGDISLVMDTGVRHQVMDNFGANDAWYLQRIEPWPEKNKEHIADLLFSTNDGIGLSCWRFYVGAGISTNNIRERGHTAESFGVAPGVYDWSREAGQRWFLRAAKARGVRQFIATVYSPPLWLTRNGLSNLGADTNSTTNLKPGAEDAYAQYLTDILVHFRDNPDASERVEFDYVLPANEPQWAWQHGQEGNRVSNADLKRIYAALAARLKEAGLKTKILGPDSGSIPDMYEFDESARKQWQADYGDYLDWICGDPQVATGFGGVVSYHSYWSDEIPGQLAPRRERLGRALAQYPGWKIWESEYCVMERGRDLGMDTALRVARVIHCDLTLANASAWQWWLAVANENYKSGLIYTDYRKPGDAQNILDSKILWVLGNYSRFIRPGMVRVDIRGAQDIQGLMASAYLNPVSGEIVMVLVNMGEQAQRVKIQFTGEGVATAGSGKFTPYVTSAEDSLREGKPVEVGDGVVVAGRSVVTLVSD